ncbi:MAG: M23 family metallopeptidase [Bacteroidetes bacterium]|nr:M23 family metallopeptidase [Bacteroidota bacterium]
MMSWFNLNNLKKSSIYFTPNFPTLQTKRYKVKLYTVLSYAALYTFVVSIFIALILAFTPARQFLLFVEDYKLKENSVQIKQLEQKVLLLYNEIDQISLINKRLKFAIKLASTDSLDSTAAIYDSLRLYEQIKRRSGGNIYSVINDFAKKYLSDSDSVKEILFLKPCEGIIAKSFQPGKGHNGIDFAVVEKSPVYASMSGVVIFADYTFNYGYTIIIQHDKGYTTHYKHCSVLLKNERDVVKSGEVIALSGNTGFATTGPHLHFEIWKNNQPLDPAGLVLN